MSDYRRRAEYFDLDELDSLDDELDSWDELDSDLDPFVFGTDDRFQVCRHGCKRSPLQFPLNTVCRVGIPGGGFGSGTLIAPQVVLTAKHVLTSGGTFSCGHAGGARTTQPSVSISVGRDGATTSARPAAIAVPANRVRTHPTLDVGVAILPRPAVGPTQFMSLQARSDANTQGVLLSLAGYPGDKPANTMWAASDRVVLVTPTTLFHKIDLVGGESGGPVWLLGADQLRLLLAVQSGERANGPNANCATRITCEVIRRILAWCREFGVRAPSVSGLARC